MTESLMQIIERKMRERYANARAPHDGDRVTNPLAIDSAAHKPLYRNVTEKRTAYNAALDSHAYAINANGDRIYIGTPGAEFNNVEFISGLWRVQRPFNQQITNVRDRQFVLMDKLPHTERTLFEFYRAAHVGINCYGPFCSGIADYVVAKYETDNGTYWSYGRTLEEARAFLGIKMYDEYMYLINSVARANSLSQKQK